MTYLSLRRNKGQERANKLTMVKRPIPDVVLDSLTESRRKSEDHQKFLRGIINLLNNKDWNIREAAAEELCRIKSKDTVPALRKRLTDEFPHVCAPVARALGKIGDPSAVPDLIKKLQRSENEDSHTLTAVAEALGKFGRNAKDAVPLLEKLVGDHEHIGKNGIHNSTRKELYWTAEKALRRIKRGWNGNG